MEREPFSLSSTVKEYIKLYAARPELRKLDTAVGNAVLKAIHGRGHFGQDRKTVQHLAADDNFCIDRENETTADSGAIYCTGLNMQLPSDFRSEINVLLLDEFGELAGEASNLANLGIVDSINTISINKRGYAVPYYFMEFSSEPAHIAPAFWDGNTIKIVSPLPFSQIRLTYWGYGKKYTKDMYNLVTSVSWIDQLYPEYVALEIAKQELISAGYSETANNYEALRRELEHSFMVDQADQEGSADNG